MNTPGYAWIENFNRTENGRGALQASTNHYNGIGELSKRVALAQAQLKVLYYKNEKAMSFETFSSKMQRTFQVLNKDSSEKFSDRQQVDRLLSAIQTDNTELVGSKVIISSEHHNDFVSACAFFSQQVSIIYSAVQLEDRTHFKWRISPVSSVQSGKGQNHFGNRNRGGYGRGRSHGFG